MPSWHLQAWILLFLAAATPYASAQSIKFDEKWQEITFSGIAPNIYKREHDALRASVKKSHSFLVYAFDQPKSAFGFSFLWRRSGTLAVKDRAQESTKAGDDAWFRIGLIVSGKAPLIPFFAPSWLKILGKKLTLDADRLIYYILDARHPPGSQWDNPYHSSIKNHALASGDATKDGWTSAQASWDKELKLAGLWFSADGDDTGSTFDVSIKDFVLREQK